MSNQPRTWRVGYNGTNRRHWKRIQFCDLGMREELDKLKDILHKSRGAIVFDALFMYLENFEKENANGTIRAHGQGNQIRLLTR